MSNFFLLTVVLQICVADILLVCNSSAFPRFRDNERPPEVEVNFKHSSEREFWLQYFEQTDKLRITEGLRESFRQQLANREWDGVTLWEKFREYYHSYTDALEKIPKDLELFDVQSIQWLRDSAMKGLTERRRLQSKLCPSSKFKEEWCSKEKLVVLWTKIIAKVTLLVKVAKCGMNITGDNILLDFRHYHEHEFWVNYFRYLNRTKLLESLEAHLQSCNYGGGKEWSEFTQQYKGKYKDSLQQVNIEIGTLAFDENDFYALRDLAFNVSHCRFVDKTPVPNVCDSENINLKWINIVEHAFVKYEKLKC